MAGGGDRAGTFPTRPTPHCTLGAEKWGASTQQEHVLAEPAGCPHTTFTSCLETPHVPPYPGESSKSVFIPTLNAPQGAKEENVFTCYKCHRLHHPSPSNCLGTH